MPALAKENTKEVQVELVEVEVGVDNHTQNGETVAKGTKIKVAPDVKKMLEASWAKTNAKNTEKVEAK